MDAPADMMDPKTWLELAEDKLVHAHQIAEYLHFLGQAQSARERSDYAPFAPISRQGAEEVLHATESFIAKVREILRA
ncbi:MAG: hypothetical protein QMD04_12270 [Anaerolineales bacterium]|nr:hypothetical protein [Anaerolineales bacterium]